MQVIATSVLLIPKMGKQLNQFTKELNILADNFKKISKTRANTEKDTLHNYLKEFYNSEGGIYETNIITTLIQVWLKDIKIPYKENAEDSEWKHKENILIIDDLDRIDPNHIFRLLNVFSAHFDNRDQDPIKNKFGFDKIILVGDIDNIHNIYKAKYGADTDFNGYIDKFYSREIYRFDNRNNVMSIMDKFFIKTMFGTFSQVDKSSFHPYTDSDKKVILFILSTLHFENAINLRSILKFSDTKLEVYHQFIRINNRSTRVISNPILFALWFCAKVVGDFRMLERRLEQLAHFNNQYSQVSSMEYVVANLCMLANTNTGSKNGSNAFFVEKTKYSIRGFTIEYEVFQPSGKRDTFEARFRTLANESDEEFNFTKANVIINSSNWVALLRAAVKNLSK